MLSLMYIYLRLQPIYRLRLMFRVKQSLYVGAHTQSLTPSADHLRKLIVDSLHLLLTIVKRDRNTIVLEVAKVSRGQQVIVLVVSW